MHYAALQGSRFHDARQFGWNIDENVDVNYKQMVQNVNSYVKKLNFSYKKGLRSAKVEYINAKARLSEDVVSSREVLYEDKDSNTIKVTGTHILLAVGGRPVIPLDVEGAKDHAITSDDLFWRKEDPGRVLVVGGSYIALETAGFLTHLGKDVTVAVRSILLRGFDRQSSEKVGAVMLERGTKFLYSRLPTKIIPVDGASAKYEVTFNDGSFDHFDTVLYATGRYPDTKAIDAKAAGIHLKDGKIPIGHLNAGSPYETDITNVHAVGDIVHGGLELTPVAIAQGEHLASILFGTTPQSKTLTNIATTVFTPVEYGFVGLSEEEAIETYGEEGIEVYHSEFEALENSASYREKVESTRMNEYDMDESPSHLAKLVCTRASETNPDEKILGIHYVGDQAGEVLQGFAIALQTGVLLKRHFDQSVGIHPTAAEIFTTLTITKRSGENHVAAGGCGGGKCG